MAKKVNYEDRLTLFVDFLGFKEKIEETESNSEVLQDLVYVMSEVSVIAKEGDPKEFEVSQFSDCLVISYGIKNFNLIFEIVNKLSHVVVRAAELGYLIRGGLTFGRLLHTKQLVLGPAMSRAYHLESQVAKMPRVILDPVEFNEALLNPAHDAVKAVKKFLKWDKSCEVWYFDYFSSEVISDVVGGDPMKYPRYLKILSGMIEEGLKSSHPGVLEKYIWMQKRYQLARKKFTGAPEDHPTRVRFPGYLESIEQLPMLKKEAAGAAEIVAKAEKERAKKCRGG
ncbi:hypothetical protein DFS21_11391 [Pseudomonas sp. 2848]|uniref:hypothetical protein n=1 Tax=Pseudomonas sp. 2848 TaxID=2183926 RepID=UPI000DB1E108|nr:hypothetical protein [Pseudomonas sp. 2848]PZW75184.1 hypothetical protein DFS21_11391 [Pseudomonas sp. 2848]